MVRIRRRVVLQVAMNCILLVLWHINVIRESASSKTGRALRLMHGGPSVD
jgi:hypothetical protein